MTFLLLTAAVLTASPRAKAPDAKLSEAEASYDDYKYPRAISQLRLLLDDPAFKDGPSRQKARVLLSFSYYLSQRESEAAQELTRLFRENTEYPLDRDATHPDLLRFYDTERNSYLASLQVAPAATPPTSAPVEIKLPPPPPAEQTTGDKQPWVRIIPLGIGHFLNNDIPGGAAFLAVELALVGANATFAILREGLRAPDGKFRVGTDPAAFQWAMNAAAISAIVVAVIDIVDAFVWSPERGRKALQRKLSAPASL